GHARFRAIVAAEPDRPSANEVADHDPIRVTFADGDLVDTDHGWPRSSHLGQLGAHVLLVQLLHRMPVELELLGDIPDRSTAAASANIKGKSLGMPPRVRNALGPPARKLSRQRYSRWRRSLNSRANAPTLSPAIIRRTAASFISRLKTRFGISSPPENCLYYPCLIFGVHSSGAFLKLTANLIRNARISTS